MVAKYSPKGLHELLLYYPGYRTPELFPEELESFFTSRTNHSSQKSLSLYIFNSNRTKLNNLSDKNNENMEIIKKYIKLGVIKEFKTTNY